MGSFMHALRVSSAHIGEFAGSYKEIPTMKNGRCFPSSVALLSQCFCDVQAHMQFQRNHIGCPILADGSIDHKRHDVEVEFAKHMADEIVQQLSGVSPPGSDCIRRLQNGHVTEEEDIQVIAEAMNLCVELTYPGGKEEPFMHCNRAGSRGVRLVLSSTSLDTTAHFQAVRGCANRPLMNICVEACKMWCQVPDTKDRQIHALGAKVSTLQRRCRRLRRRVQTFEDLKQRVEVLEAQACN
jgi:hypothetical protein